MAGKLRVCYFKWPFIADLPLKNGDFPWLFVCLPEGKWLVNVATGCLSAHRAHNP